MNKYLDPRKYKNKLSTYWDKIYYERKYNIEEFRELERHKFEKLGIDRDEGLNKLNQILHKLGKPDFSSQRGMGSIHWVLFCSLSLVYSIKDILEIGTFDGETTRLLTEIFPDSRVTSLDLPDDDPILAGSYLRTGSERLRDFKEIQNENTRHQRIKFIQVNSFYAPRAVQGKFDLVWIDGGHLYPEVAWDICNAYHFCNPGGLIMCDDVIPNRKGLRDEYVSPDSHFVLEYVSQRTGEELVYFLKREGTEWSANPYKRKYIALMRKSQVEKGCDDSIQNS